jgi:hypothetical protein
VGETLKTLSGPLPNLRADRIAVLRTSAAARDGTDLSRLGRVHHRRDGGERKGFSASWQWATTGIVSAHPQYLEQAKWRVRSGQLKRDQENT